MIWPNTVSERANLFCSKSSVTVFGAISEQLAAGPMVLISTLAAPRMWIAV